MLDIRIRGICHRTLGFWTLCASVRSLPDEALVKERASEMAKKRAKKKDGGAAAMEVSATITSPPHPSSPDDGNLTFSLSSSLHSEPTSCYSEDFLSSLSLSESLSRLFSVISWVYPTCGSTDLMCGTSARENLSSCLFVATVTFLFNSREEKC